MNFNKFLKVQFKKDNLIIDVCMICTASHHLANLVDMGVEILGMELFTQEFLTFCHGLRKLYGVTIKNYLMRIKNKIKNFH